jgi:hypothetical protein
LLILQNFKNIFKSSNFSPCIGGSQSKVSDVNLQNFKNIFKSSNFSWKRRGLKNSNQMGKTLDSCNSNATSPQMS